RFGSGDRLFPQITSSLQRVRVSKLHLPGTIVGTWTCNSPWYYDYEDKKDDSDDIIGGSFEYALEEESSVTHKPIENIRINLRCIVEHIHPSSSSSSSSSSYNLLHLNQVPLNGFSEGSEKDRERILGLQGCKVTTATATAAAAAAAAATAALAVALGGDDGAGAGDGDGMVMSMSVVVGGEAGASTAAASDDDGSGGGSSSAAAATLEAEAEAEAEAATALTAALYTLYSMFGWWRPRGTSITYPRDQRLHRKSYVHTDIIYSQAINVASDVPRSRFLGGDSGGRDGEVDGGDGDGDGGGGGGGDADAAVAVSLLLLHSLLASRRRGGWRREFEGVGVGPRKGRERKRKEREEEGEEEGRRWIEKNHLATGHYNNTLFLTKPVTV
ncbi:LOW QUALITY PROTEIN: hypothetical protein V1477_005999, partial [Vespula maculifrons]